MHVQQIKGNKVFAIDRYRILAGLSQADVEERTGISRSRYSTIEALSYDDLDKIAELFGIGREQLFLPTVE